MKFYTWREDAESIVDSCGNVVLSLCPTKIGGDKFMRYCGELLTNTLNEEELWKVKLDLFVSAQTSKKETML